MRHLPDRWLHPGRRARARDRLARSIPGTDSVVFVCYGNICRSPFAARALEDALPSSLRDGLLVESTGFYAEEGRISPPEAVRAARRYHVDLSDHRSRSVRSGALPTAGGAQAAVFVMEPGQRDRWLRVARMPASRVFVLGDFDPESIGTRSIRDPFGHPEEMFAAVYDRISRCVDEVARLWGEVDDGTVSDGGRPSR